jgi:hypothetical protein
MFIETLADLSIPRPKLKFFIASNSKKYDLEHADFKKKPVELKEAYVDKS